MRFGQFASSNRVGLEKSRDLLNRATAHSDAPLTAWLRLAQLIADSDRATIDIENVDPDNSASVRALEERLLNQDKANKANARKANRIYQETVAKFPWSVDAAIGWARTHPTITDRNRAFNEICVRHKHAWRILDAWASDLDDALPFQLEPGIVVYDPDIRAVHYTVYDRLLLLCPKYQKAAILMRLAYACYRYQDRNGIARAYQELVERDVGLAANARKCLEDGAYLSRQALPIYMFPIFE
jgi:hypothetical protein